MQSNETFTAEQMQTVLDQLRAPGHVPPDLDSNFQATLQLSEATRELATPLILNVAYPSVGVYNLDTHQYTLTYFHHEEGRTDYQRFREVVRTISAQELAQEYNDFYRHQRLMDCVEQYHQAHPDQTLGEASRHCLPNNVIAHYNQR